MVLLLIFLAVYVFVYFFALLKASKKFQVLGSVAKGPDPIMKFFWKLTGDVQSFLFLGFIFMVFIGGLGWLIWSSAKPDPWLTALYFLALAAYSSWRLQVLLRTK
jgi:hypothetical protein